MEKEFFVFSEGSGSCIDEPNAKAKRTKGGGRRGRIFWPFFRCSQRIWRFSWWKRREVSSNQEPEKFDQEREKLIEKRRVFETDRFENNNERIRAWCDLRRAESNSESFSDCFVKRCNWRRNSSKREKGDYFSK